MATGSSTCLDFGHGFRLEIQDGQIQIGTDAGEILFDAVGALASFRDGTCASLHGERRELTIGEERIVLRAPGSSSQPELEWTLRANPHEAALRISLRVTNTTRRKLQLERIVPLEAPSGLDNSAPESLQVYSPGYMSWSAHLVAKLPALHIAGDRVLEPTVTRALPDGLPLPWVAYLDDGNAQVLLGFTTSNHHIGLVELGQERGSVIAWNDGEGAALEPGQIRDSEELLILLGEERNAAMSKYATEIARHKRYRKGGPSRPPAGWCSWSAFFENVTLEDILDTLEAASDLKREIPLDYFQLDDFYTRIGDWLDLHDHLLNGSAGMADGPAREREVNRQMRDLAERIRRKGFVPGLWLAPFLVNANSKLYRKLGNRSDWLIRDEAGDAISSVYCWNGPNYSLDLTNPEAEAHLRRIIRTVVHEWGFKLLKLDFLYAALLHGKRHDPDKTSVEAYNLFLEILAQEAGEAQVLFCGAPLVESAGGAYMRIGPDVADRIGPQWYAASGLRSDRTSPAAVNSVGESLTRAAWLEALYDNVDSDSLITRLDADSGLTPAERGTIIAAIRATNSVISLGDDLRGWTQERTFLLRNAASLTCRAAEPVAFDGMGRPTAMQLTVDDRRHEITLINWSDEPAALVFDPSLFLGIGNAVYILDDVMTGQKFGLNRGPIVLPPTPAHGSRVLNVVER